MKKYLLYVIAAMMALTSCTDSEEVDVKYGVKVTVDPSTVLAPFHGYNIVDNPKYGLDMFSLDGAIVKLRILSLIYDENGELVDEVEGLLNDYNSQIEYTLDWLEDGKKYTVVTISNSILKYETGTGTYSSYKIENKDLLSKLSISQITVNEDYPVTMSYHSNWSVLGLAVNTIDNKTYNNRIDLKPATAMVFSSLCYYHAGLADGIDSYSFRFQNNNFISSFSNSSWKYSSHLANNEVDLDITDVTVYENDDFNLISVYNFLPTENMYFDVLSYKGADVAEYLDYDYINIEAGKEYLFYIDCANSQVTVEELIMGEVEMKL